MNIESRKQMKYVIAKDLEMYKKAGYKNDIISFFMNNDVGRLVKYMKNLRHEEYWLFRKKSNIITKAVTLFYRSRRQAIGGKIGVFVPPGTVGYGLWILHSGNIIVNERAKIGNNCVFAGMNCIGVDSILGDYARFPQIGNGVFLGIGAFVIGAGKKPDNSIVAAGAVVVNEYKNSCLLAGAPAKLIKEL